MRVSKSQVTLRLIFPLIKLILHCLLGLISFLD